jgi:hypothetical protein
LVAWSVSVREALFEDLVGVTVGVDESLWEDFDEVGSSVELLGVFVEDGFVGVGFLVELVLIFLAFDDFGLLVLAGGLGSTGSPVCAFASPKARHLEKRGHSFDC